MSETISQPRAKRQKIDKKGRFAALSRLKELKGTKNKYELSDVDNVYDLVDEKEYAKNILNRASDDWIEDDGTGYVEDGREIFDDVSEDEEHNLSKSAKKSKKDNKKKEKNKVAPIQGKGNIRDLFAGVKRKETVVKLDSDDILADILDDINEKKPEKRKLSDSSSDSKKSSTQEPTNNISKTSNKKNIEDDANIMKEYMQSFSENLKKTIVSKSDENTSDDEMLDRISKPQPKVITKKINRINTSVSKVSVSKVDIKVEPNAECSTSEDVNSTSSKVEETKSEIETENTPKETDLLEENDLNDLDLSCLDDAENQFLPEETQPVNKKSRKSEENKILNEILTEKSFLNAWNEVNIENNNSVNDISISENDDLNFDEKSELKIWFWDAWEDSKVRPGEIYLFGRVPVENKTDEFKSVCVQVQNVERCLFLLPREYTLDEATKEPTSHLVTHLDVYQEFDQHIAPNLKINPFRCRKVNKKFSFSLKDVNVPEQSDYLEVRYHGKFPAPLKNDNYLSIAYIFGTNTSLLETFLIEKKIKGPCWLTLRNFTITDRSSSWCKVQVVCPDTNSIQVSQMEKSAGPVPLSLMTLNIRTAFNPKTIKNEIVMIGCLVNTKFAIDKKPDKTPFQRHFCGFTRPSLTVWPNDLTSSSIQNYKETQITKFDSERVLLSWFLTLYQKIDPDLIVTHDANDCQLEVLCDRIMTLKINLWSRLGRLKLSNQLGNRFKHYMIGRMVCDIKESSEELIKSKSYDLSTLCQTVLKTERIDVSNELLISMYENAEGIFKLISLTMQDCLYTIRIMCELNVLPLALQITNICGNLMSRTLEGGRSERNEYYLLHAFTEKDYIVPDKRGKEISRNTLEDISTAKKKAAYAGGLVLEPIKGFYDNYILLMDFNSLYPSIIQEYNICFTTIIEPPEGEQAILPPNNIEQGVLPRQIRRLVESRREVKKLMANPDLDTDTRIQYNIRQLALKLTANSMYGCLGFSLSRFYAQHLASLVTQKGREILMNTKNLVQKLNYEVVYGDTDSIMVNTNVLEYEDVYKIGNSIKQSVNKIYKQVELDIDGIFKRLLLLKKKKYAALIVEKDKSGKFVEKQELKGLDIVRRDWSQIAVIAGKLIINEILSDNQMDTKIVNISTHLEKIGNNLREGKTPLSVLVITKQLTKSLKDYSNSNPQPHVTVAMRMNQTKNKRYKKGDVVGYIICLDGTDNAAMKRAYHIDELKSQENLTVDIEYYLIYQVHAVVARLLEVIDQIDSYRIAELLGVDPTKFKSIPKISNDNDFRVGDSIKKSNPYQLCEKFKFKCLSCEQVNEIDSAFRKSNQNDKISIPILQKCITEKCSFSFYQNLNLLQNALHLAARGCIKRFYENWFVCNNAHCSNNTRTYTHIFDTNGYPVCLMCDNGRLERQYTAVELNNQLHFYQYMFDLSQYDEKLTSKLPQDLVNAYQSMKKIVDNILNNSNYNIISLKNIFKNY